MIMCKADKIAESLFSIKGTVHCEQCQKVVIEAAKICAEAGKKRLFNILADKAILYCLDGDGYASEKVWAANTAEELGLKKRATELYKSAVEGFIKDLR